MISAKQKILILLLTMLVSLVPIVPARAIGDPVSAASGVYGDTIVVTGIGGIGGFAVELYWDSPKAWDGEMGLLNSSEAESDGSWEIWFDVPEAVNGTHYLYVEDTYTGDVDKDNEAFIVTPSLDFDVDSALPGDEIEVSGYGFTAVEEIVFVHMTNTTVYNETISLTPSTPVSDAVGSWSATFEIPDGIVYGDYYFTAKDAGGVIVFNESFTVGVVISLSQDSADSGDIVRVNGRGFTAGNTISESGVALFDSSNFWGCRIVDYEVIIGPDGEFTFDIIVPDTGYVGTDFDLHVSDGVFVAETSFEVTALPEIYLMPNYGPQGSTIELFGLNFPDIDGYEVELEVWNYGGWSEVSIDTIETNSDGSLNTTLVLPAIASDDYLIKAFLEDPVGLSGPEWNFDASTNLRVGMILVLLSEYEGPSGVEVVLTGSGFTRDGLWNATFDGETLFETNQVDAGGLILDGGETPSFYVPPVEPGAYYITVLDVDSGIEVIVPFNVTKKTQLTISPSAFPSLYNVTISGCFFAQHEFNDLYIQVHNETHEWEITEVYSGMTLFSGLDTGNFTIWWIAEQPNGEILELGDYTLTVVDEDDFNVSVAFTITDDVYVSPPSALPFDQVIVSGFGVPSGTIAELYWDSIQPWDGVAGLLNLTMVQNDGIYNIWFNVPFSSIGLHDLWIREASSGDTYSIPFTVESPDPISVNLGSTQYWGRTIYQDLSVSDPSFLYNVTWDWGDGHSDVYTNANSRSHLYSAIGTYTITVVATNVYGVSNWDSLQVSVEDSELPVIVAHSKGALGPDIQLRLLSENDTRIQWRLVYDDITSDVLAEASMLIATVSDSSLNYSTGELDVILDWYLQGDKTIWVTGDSDYSTDEPRQQTANQLLDLLDSKLRIESTSVEDPVSNGGTGYRVVGVSEFADSEMDPLLLGVDTGLFHGPGCVIGYVEGEYIELETDPVDDVYVLMTTSDAGIIVDNMAPVPEIHSVGQTGAFPLLALETVPDLKNNIIVSGDGIYGHFMGLYAPELLRPDRYDTQGKTLVDNIIWHTVIDPMYYEVSYSSQITLQSDWNLIGTGSNVESSTIEEILGDKASLVEYVYEYDSTLSEYKYWINSLPSEVQTLHNLNSNQGYWVKTNSATTLTFEYTQEIFKP